MARLGPDRFQDPDFVLGNLIPRYPSFDVGTTNHPWRNGTFSGTLTVAGAVTFSGGIAVTGNLSVSGTSTLTGLVTASAGLNLTGTLAVTGAATVSTTLGVTGLSTLTGGANLAAGLTFTVATAGITLKTGANGRFGTFTINGNTPVVVSNTSIAAGDIILLARHTPAGTPGAFNVTARTNGTSFTVTGTAADTSTVDYMLVATA